MDPPLSLVIHIIVTLQKKNKNKKTPAFVSLGEDDRCISTF